MTEPSIFSFIVNASPLVKFVLLLLFAASVASWTMILQRWFFLRDAKDNIRAFEKKFWAGGDLVNLYKDLQKKEDGADLQGMEQIFYAAFTEFLKLRSKKGIESSKLMNAVERSMRVTLAREMDELEKHLSFLATVGSVSPYVGLFGTVWGIMTAFRSLSGVGSATIAMVAPGISEALIATAMGLFAAIPAVIAYNRYADRVERISNAYSTFQEELLAILHRGYSENDVNVAS